jgi:hypothetical protein
MEPRCRNCGFVRAAEQLEHNWNDQQIQTNMFQKYEQAKVIATPVDQDSIMMYPIPSSWTLDGFSAGLNRELSAQDKELIRKVYYW